MLLLARRLKRWAHDTGIFPTDTLSIALFDGNSQSTIAFERKRCIPCSRLIINTVTQVEVHLLGIDNLARVEQMIRVCSLFQVSHCVHQRWSIGLLKMFGANQAIAVLTAQRATELQSQGQDCLRDRSQVCNTA